MAPVKRMLQRMTPTLLPLPSISGGLYADGQISQVS
jgi:hypothetical protein